MDRNDGYRGATDSWSSRYGSPEDIRTVFAYIYRPPCRFASELKGWDEKGGTPSDFFQLFFDSDILTRFVEQTNSYAKNTSRRAWRDTDEKELKTFLSIILYMDINKKPQRFMHWDDSKFQSPWVSSMMTKTRFEELLRIWYWTDTTQMTQEEYIAERN